jgi:hypothetical protein
MDNEKRLKQAASLYVKQMGDQLLREQDKVQHDMDVDLRVWRWRMNRRVRIKRAKIAAFVAAPMAAGLLLVILVMGWPSADPYPADTAGMAAVPMEAPQSAETAAAEAPPLVPPIHYAPPRPEIALLSAKLPQGYTLAFTDYDHGKTIYHINSDLANELVLTAEYAAQPLAADGFTRTTINEMEAYVLVRRSYSVLLLYSDGVQYTLTGRFDANDLVEVASAVL